MSQTGQPAPLKTLRLWPGLVAVVLQWLLMFGVPLFARDTLIVYGMMGGIVAGVVVAAWWLFFSRASLLERWGAVVLMIVASVATSRIVDKSIATGLMGYMFPFYSIPTLCLGVVVWAAFIRLFGERLSVGPRRASLVAAILLACAAWTLVRTNGITGEAASDFAWRWSKTHEEMLVAGTTGQSSALPVALPATPVSAKIASERAATHQDEDLPAVIIPIPVTAKADANWPGFRGPGRDSIISGTHINATWSTSPPVELWRRPIGPGWGSFAVLGDLIYTQEQRGDDEIVTCYNAATGNPVWAHRDATRFWESNGGAGPRATPTLHNGRVYSFGATGIVNALDAANGAVLWSRNAGTDTGTKVPGWGFASSPLVVGDTVIVAASGHLIAYAAATGAPRWSGPDAGGSYSSPHLATIDGVTQILLLGALGATSVAPADGTLLWKYSWPSDTRVMQPAVMAEGDLLISSGDAMGGAGVRRIAIAHGSGGWTTEERWTSTGLKPSFNDFVVYEGHVFGFDGGILACIDAKDGQRKWKGGRYGHGQLVLLRDQGLLLVLSEEGELALVKATPDQFTELARVPAMEGKTWNHPVLAGDRLLVRNGTEMVGFRLSLARPSEVH